MKGLVVPDNPNPDLNRIGLIKSTTDSEWIGIIRGLLLEACYGYWWDKDTGDWEIAKGTACEIASSFMTIDFCSEVARCIKENEAVRLLIQALVKETTTGITPETITTVLGKGTTVLDECSEDHVFGAMTYLVNYLDSASRDTFELLEASTNLAELVVEWLEDFAEGSPLLATALQYVSWLQDTIAENYDANVTTALLDEYRCDLFCLYIENCNGLTAQQVAEYFLQRISGIGVTDTLQTLVDFLLDGSWDGSQIVDAMFASMIGVMIVGENPITQIRIPTLYSFDQIVRLGANDPDPDWEILCDECAEPIWCYFVDLTQTSFDFVMDNRGEWQFGVGLVNTDDTRPSNPNQGIFADRPAWTDTTLTRVEMTYSLSSESASTRTARFILQRNGSTIAQVIDNANVDDGTLVWTGETVIDDIRVNVDVRQGSNALEAGEYAIVKSIEFRGLGVNPFGDDNC